MRLNDMLLDAFYYTFYLGGWLIFTMIAFSQWVIYAKLKNIQIKKTNKVINLMANLFLMNGLIFLIFSGMPIFVYLGRYEEKTVLEYIITVLGAIHLISLVYFIKNLEK